MTKEMIISAVIWLGAAYFAKGWIFYPTLAIAYTLFLFAGIEIGESLARAYNEDYTNVEGKQ